MGREAKAKAEIRHRKQLFGGRYTAEEVHRSASFPKGAVCGGCRSSKVAIRARTFVPFADFVKNMPELAMQMAAANGGSIPCVDFKHGRHVRVGDAYACDLCAGALERALARGPSWVVVDIERGPGPERPVVQVTGDIGQRDVKPENVIIGVDMASGPDRTVVQILGADGRPIRSGCVAAASVDSENGLGGATACDLDDGATSGGGEAA